jgi:lipopolysaccharide export system permease protein
MEAHRYRYRLSPYLSRYIFGQVTFTFFIVMGAMIGTYWIIGSLDHLRWVINSGMPFLDYLYFNALMIPANLSPIVPVGAVIAVIFVYNRLSSEHELVAMYAGGLSNMQVAAAGIAFAGTVSAVLVVYMSYFAPATFREFRAMRNDVKNASLVLNLKEREFTSVADDLAIYVGKRHSSSEFEDILVWETKDPEVPVTILADQAKLVFDHGKAFFVLSDGMLQSYDRESSSATFSNFEQYTFNLKKYVEEKEPLREEARELLIHDLWVKVMAETRGYSYRAQANSRIADVLEPFVGVVAALAILFAGPMNRRGHIWRIAAAVVVMLAVKSAFAILVKAHSAVTAATSGILLISAVLIFASLWAIVKGPLKMSWRGWWFSDRRRAAA